MILTSSSQHHYCVNNIINLLLSTSISALGFTFCSTIGFGEKSVLLLCGTKEEEGDVPPVHTERKVWQILAMQAERSERWMEEWLPTWWSSSGTPREQQGNSCKEYAEGRIFLNNYFKRTCQHSREQHNCFSTVVFSSSVCKSSLVSCSPPAISVKWSPQMCLPKNTRKVPNLIQQLTKDKTTYSQKFIQIKKWQHTDHKN